MAPGVYKMIMGTADAHMETEVVIEPDGTLRGEDAASVYTGHLRSSGTSVKGYISLTPRAAADHPHGKSTPALQLAGTINPSGIHCTLTDLTSRKPAHIPATLQWVRDLA